MPLSSSSSFSSSAGASSAAASATGAAAAAAAGANAAVAIASSISTSSSAATSAFARDSLTSVPAAESTAETDSSVMSLPALCNNSAAYMYSIVIHLLVINIIVDS